MLFVLKIFLLIIHVINISHISNIYLYLLNLFLKFKQLAADPEILVWMVS